MRYLLLTLTASVMFLGVDALACSHGGSSGGSFAGTGTPSYSPSDAVPSTATGTPAAGTPAAGTPSAGTPSVGTPSVGTVGFSIGSRRGGVPEEWFAPGSEYAVAWNTSQKLKDRPIVVYLYDGHVTTGKAFDFAKWTEMNIFRQKKVANIMRDFYCEKICLRDDGVLHNSGDRPFLAKYLKGISKQKAAKRKPSVAILDSKGEVIKTYNGKIKSHSWWAKELKKAQKVNTQRLAKATSKQACDAGTDFVPKSAMEILAERKQRRRL